MKNIVLFLDVDGVLNQYDRHERIRRHKLHKKADFSMETDSFNPFIKKVLRLTKLVKKYKIDVYVFSAWTAKNLQPHLPFKLTGDSNKWISTMNEISAEYKHAIVIDDEISVISDRGCKGEDIKIDSNIITFQPYYQFGLVKKDFVKLDYIFQNMK
jgi:hypothetical protein